VINFDDTITKLSEQTGNGEFEEMLDNYSVREICHEVVRQSETDAELTRNSGNAIKFLAFLNREDFLGKKEFAGQSFIKAFYEKVLGGISENKLNEIYENVINNEDPAEAIRLDENFIEAVKVISESLEQKELSLLVLSLNTPNMMRKWYEKHLPTIKGQLQVDGINLNLVEIMGNQISFDENGRVAGVLEHVKNKNKKDYIPDGAPMLADNRETTERANDGVNVVNIEGRNFNPQLVEYTAEYYIIYKVVKSLENSQSPDAEIFKQVLNKLEESLKNEKICREVKSLPFDERPLTYSDITGYDLDDLSLQNKIELYREQTQQSIQKFNSITR